jgi:hypothetical protein
MLVVDDLMADIDRLAIFIERLFHDIDGAHDPGAKAAWLGKDYAHLKRSDPVFPAGPSGTGPAAAALQHRSFPYPRGGRNPFLGMGKMRGPAVLPEPFWVSAKAVAFMGKTDQ